MTKKQLEILIVIIAVGLITAVILSLNTIYGWLQDKPQEIVIALIMAIIAGVMIESVYKKLSPQPRMLKTTRTHLADHKESLPQLELPNNNHIIVSDSEKVLGREDFLGVITSDKLYFIGKDHLKITRKDNSIYLQDLNTKNGTTLNGMELEANQMHRLDDGDEIVVAKSLHIKYKES